VSALVAAHGGVASVRTAPGRGATFRIALPLAPEAQGDMAADDDADLDEPGEASEPGPAEEAGGAGGRSGEADSQLVEADGADGAGDTSMTYGTRVTGGVAGGVAAGVAGGVAAGAEPEAGPAGEARPAGDAGPVEEARPADEIRQEAGWFGRSRRA